MATDIRNLVAYLSNDADFRAWGSGLAAQFAAVGLIKTADTGQIDWATVTRPVAVMTNAGYEIWRFNDALQATKPVFIRIDYGTGLAALDRPRLGMRVGTATDGAGNLAGQLNTAGLLALPGGSKAVGALLPSFCSGSSSRLTLLTHVDLSSSGVFGSMIFIERTKTALGVDTGDGIATYISSYNQTLYQAIPFSGTVPTGVNYNPAIPLASTNGQVSSVGPNVAISPTIVCLGKACFASWAAYVIADIPKLAPISVDHLGAMRTMLPLGDAAIGSGQTTLFGQGVNAGHSFAILWE